jgi:hypothetical protein
VAVKLPGGLPLFLGAIVVLLLVNAFLVAAVLAPSDALRVGVTAFLTLLVFVMGQGVLKFGIEPVLALRGVIGEAEAVLTLHEYTYSVPPQCGPDGQVLPYEAQMRLEARAKFLEVASKLSAASQTVPCGYEFAVQCKLIPSRAAIRRARRQLIVLSGLTAPVSGPGGNLALGPEAAQQVREALELPPNDS